MKDLLGIGPSARLQGTQMKATQSLFSIKSQSLNLHLILKPLFTKNSKPCQNRWAGSLDDFKWGIPQPEQLAVGPPRSYCTKVVSALPK